MKDRLVSSQRLRESLLQLEERTRSEAPFNPDYVVKREERLILEFRQLIREAEAQYVTSGVATELTGWDGATMRKYGRLALAGDPVPEEWSRLVVKREGKEYAFVLSTIPARPERNVA